MEKKMSAEAQSEQVESCADDWNYNSLIQFDI